MNRTGWTMLMACGFLLHAASSHAESIEVKLAVPAPQVFLDDQGFTHLRLEGFQNTGRPGAPALPETSVEVLLPPGHVAVGVEVLPTTRVPLPGVHVVAPAQRLYPPSHRGPRPFTDPDPAVYTSRLPFPDRTGEAMPVQSKRGFRLQPVRVRPVVYLPQAGKLSYAPALVVRVETAPAGFPATYRGFARDLDAASKTVDNPAQAIRYPLRDSPTRDVEHRYVIVTSRTLMSCEGEHTLEALAAEKRDRGFTTRIEAMEDIQAAYPGEDDAEKVRNFILDMYVNHGADYVLLAGDADLAIVGGETEAVVVPVRGLWGDIEYGGEETNLPSDLYYACLDGTFDADLDGVYGEETDDVDLMAEVHVGRAPVDSCAEVANFVRKTLAYRETLAESLRNTWLAAEWLGPDSYAAPVMEALRTGSWEGGEFLSGFVENPFFEIQTLYDAGVCERDCWGPQEILDVMNGDIHILNHCGHSYTNYNMRVTSDDIDAGLQNTTYFFQYTGGCYPGSFDNRLDPMGGEGAVQSQDSFVEHLLLGEHGAFASVMFTRYGVGDLLQRLFWDGAFADGLKELGPLHTHAREVAAPLVQDPYVRWQVYSLNLFGDPEVALHMSDSAAPVLGLPGTPLFFAGIEGGENPDSVTFSVRNDGGGALAWSVTSDQPWLTASPSSGTAPTVVTASVDTGGMAKGEHTGHLTITAPDAVEPVASIEVYLYVGTTSSMDVPHLTIAPTVDGSMPPEEYDDAAFLDIGMVAAGRSTARLAHDGEKLYLALSLADDPDADDWDSFNLYLDVNNDDRWPPQAGDDGVYAVYGDGSALFVPFIEVEGGYEYGEYDLDPAGIEVALGMEYGARILEMSFDLETSRLKTAAGESFGMALLYWDHLGGEDYDSVGLWPSIVGSVGIECPFFGDVELGHEADRVLVTPSELGFHAEAGGEPTAPQEIGIQATTESELAYTLTTSEAWILVSPEEGVTPGQVEVRIDPGSLGAGDVTGEITVIAPGAKNSPWTVTVTAGITDSPPAFGVEPDALTFEMTEGGDLPAALEIAVDNLGGGDLAWTAAPTGTWFELSTLSGTAPATLTVTPVEEELAPGRYDAAILLTAQGAAPAMVPVSLTVAERPTPDGGTDPGGGGTGCRSTAATGPLDAWPLALLLGLVLLHRRRTNS